jgi:hypothetical protein
VESVAKWLRGLDLNQRPLGYEPNELPGCSTPHSYINNPLRGGSNRDVRNGSFRLGNGGIRDFSRN